MLTPAWTSLEDGGWASVASFLGFWPSRALSGRRANAQGTLSQPQICHSFFVPSSKRLRVEGTRFFSFPFFFPNP